MKSNPSRLIARLVFAAFSVALIAIAFLRGNYLLGIEFGVMYAVIGFGVSWYLARSLVLTEKPSLIRAAAIVVLSLPLAIVMADPAAINPDVQVFIDKQATDRAARRELRALF